MFPSLPSRSWLDIVMGFLYGVITTVFVIKVLNQLRKTDPAISLVSALALYSSCMTIATLIYSSALSGGLLVEWQRLQFQRGRERGVRILEIGYIQGKSGKIYKYNQGILEQVDAINQEENSFPVVATKNNCGTLFFLPIPKVDFVSLKSACLGYGSTDVKVAYAIDRRGYVYLWQNKAHEFGELENLIITIVSGTISCVFGTMILLLLAFSRVLKNRFQQNHVRSISEM